MTGEFKHSDRNLLFAVLAVQLFRVPPAELVEVATAWAVDQSHGLADRLVEAGLLTAANRDLIWSLVDRAVEAHVGDVVATLETFGGEEQLQRTFTGSLLFTRRGVEIATPFTEEFKVELGDMPGVPETPGRYSQISEFARGAMGRVFLVHDVYLGRDIALKELLPPRPQAGPAPSETPTPVRQVLQITARFLQEARVTGQLEHPSIVPVYELGYRRDGTPYYTMKLVRGRTLSRVLAEAGNLEARLEMLPHFVDLCQAIAYAHSRGVLHRDLKPSNVMIGEFGETVVIDWGLAKARNQLDIHANPLASALLQGRLEPLLNLDQTQYGQVVGTPHYMPPEQARGEVNALDERSDVYSLGAILYQVLTGKTPYSGSTPFEIINKVIDETPPAIHVNEPDAQPEIVAICERAMRKDPAARYQTAKELADEIQRFLSGAFVQAYRYGLSEHLKRFAKQHKAVLSVSCAALVTVLGLAVYYNVHLFRARAAEREQRIAAEAANRRLEWEYYASALTEAKSNIEKENGWKATQILQRLPQHHRAWEWGRLLLESSPEVFSVADDPMRGMIGMPMRAVFSQDNRYVLSAHDFGGVKTIFDIETGATIYISEVDRFQGWPWCNGFAKESRAITIAEDDRNVVLFDYANNQVLARFSIESGWLCSFKLSPDEKLAAGYRIGPDKQSRDVVVWDVETGSEAGRYPLAACPEPPFDMDFWGTRHEPPYGMVLGFLKDNRRVVCTDEQVLVLDTATGEKQTVAPCVWGRAALAWDAETVASLVAGGGIEVWKLAPPALVKRIDARLGGFRNLEITPDARYVGIASLKSWTLWDAVAGQSLGSYVTDAVNIESLSFSPNGALAVTYGSEMTLKFWDLHLDRPRQLLPFPRSHGDSAELQIHLGTWPNRPYKYSSDVSKLAGGEDSGVVKVWEIPSFQVKREWKAHDTVVTAVAFSPDGNTLFTSSSDGTVKAWRDQTEPPLWSISADFPEPVFSIACSPDNRRVAIGFGEDTSVNRGTNHTRIVDADTGQTLFELDDPVSKTTLVAFTPDNQLILTGSWGRPGTDQRSVLFYSAADGRRLPSLVPALGWPLQALAVPNRHRLLLLGTSREPVLWDLDSHSEVYRVQRYDLAQIAVHPDGRRFVGLSGHRVMVFAIEDGRPLLTIGNCSVPLAFTVDGRSLICRTPSDMIQVLPSEDWSVTDEAVRRTDALESLQKLAGLN